MNAYGSYGHHFNYPPAWQPPTFSTPPPPVRNPLWTPPPPPVWVPEWVLYPHPGIPYWIPPPPLMWTPERRLYPCPGWQNWTPPPNPPVQRPFSTFPPVPFQRSNLNNFRRNQDTNFFNMQVEYELTQSFAVDPSVFDGESPGIDFYFPNSGVGIVMQKHEQVIVNTHVIVKLPKGMVGILMDKSSVVTKKQLKVEAGLIDTGYRGEIKVVLRNMSDGPVEIKPGEAIAQMMLHKAYQPKMKKVDKIESDTHRGTRGFGEKPPLERKEDEKKTCEVS